MPDIRYMVNDEEYEITKAEEKSFLKDFPNAKKVPKVKYKANGFDYEIYTTEVEDFLKDFPNAKPINIDTFSPHTTTVESTSPYREGEPMDVLAPWQRGGKRALHALANTPRVAGTLAEMMAPPTHEILPDMPEEYRPSTLGRKASEYLQQQIEKIEVPESDIPEASHWSDYLDPRRIYNIIGEDVPLTGSLMGITTANPIAGVAAIFMVEGGDINETIDNWEKKTGKKIDPKLKQAIVVTGGSLKTALEKYGIDKQLATFKPGKLALTKALVAEESTELAQLGIDVLAKLGYQNPEEAFKNLKEEIIETKYRTAITTLTIGGAGKITNKIKTKLKDRSDRLAKRREIEIKEMEKTVENLEKQKEGIDKDTEEAITTITTEELFDEQEPSKTQKPAEKEAEGVQKEKTKEEELKGKIIKDIPELESDTHSVEFGEKVREAENKDELITKLKEEYDKRLNSPEMEEINKVIKDKNTSKKEKFSAFEKLSKITAENQRYRQAFQVAEGKLDHILEKKKQKGLDESKKKKEKYKPQKTKEEKTQAKEDEKTTATMKEDIKILRKDFNLDELTQKERERWEDVLIESKKQGTDESALELAEEIIENPRVLTNEEHAGIVLKTAKLQNAHENAQKKAEKELEKGNQEMAERYKNVADKIIEQLDKLTTAGDYSGREAGRALNIRKFRLNRDNYSLTKLRQRLKLAKNEKLTDEESAKLEKYANTIKQQQEKIDKLNEDLEQKDIELSEKLTLDKIREIKGKKGKRSKQKIKFARKVAKEKLSELGYRVNDVTGLTFEAAKIISEIASTYVEEGYTGLKDVVKAVKKDIPDVSDKQIYDSFGGRIKNEKKKVVSEIKQQEKELKKQAKLHGKIEDAANGLFDPKRKQVPPSDEVMKLTKELNRLTKLAFKTEKDQQRLDNFIAKINKIKDQIKVGYRDVKKTKIPDNEAIVNVKEELKELRELMRTKDKIADLKEQRRTGNFKIPEKRKRIIKNQKLISEKAELQRLKREIKDYISRKRKRTLREKTLEAILTSRTLLATADVSYALRQGGLLTAMRPIKAAKIFGKAFTTLFNEKKADEIDAELKEHPLWDEMQRAGLYHADLGQVKLSEREEMFASNLAEKIPFWKHVVKASERNMLTGLNLLRASVFQDFYLKNPDATDEELKAWADFVNIASGRGDLGAFNRVANNLSYFVFAPRFSVSRVQLPYKVLKYWKHKNVRKAALKEIGAFIGLGMTALTLAKLAGADVGDDPEDANFGKIVWGNTRIDLWGGFIQPARLMGKIALKGAQRVGITEMKNNRHIKDSIADFSYYKSAPPVNIAFALLEKKDLVGNEATIKSTFFKNIIPLVLQDAYEIYDIEGDIAKSLMLLPPASAGVGMSTYKKKSKGAFK